jgi:hypothetical protein
VADPAPHTDVAILRPGVEADHSFVYASWLRNYRNAWPVRGMAPELYYHEQKRVVERLLREARLTIAADPADGSHIFGWLVGEVIPASPSAAIIHYMFVKGVMRQFGIGRKLVEDLAAGSDELLFSHAPPAPPESKDGSEPVQAFFRIAPKALYNPYAAFPR